MVTLTNGSVDDPSRLLEELENQELDAAGTTVSHAVYSQMLGLYFLQHDLCNAKFLWKRIPSETKAANAELGHIWAVGQKMWKRDFPAIYTALNRTWSQPINPIMVKLTDSVRERAFRLVSQAYSSIKLKSLASMVGLSPDEAKEAALEKGWTFESPDFIIPVKPTPPEVPPPSSEDQLRKLTEFISFLEN